MWFSLDGTGYELELSTSEAATLRALLRSYAELARRIDPPPPSKAADGIDPGEVRAWALSHGLPVAARGTLSQALIERYQQSQSTSDTSPELSRANVN